MRYKQELKQNIILLLLFLISIGTQAQYSGYPGGYWINLPAPQPPRGTTYSEIWSTKYTEHIAVSNSLVKILKYFDGTATVQCEYYYAYTVGNYQQNAKGIAYYTISCNPVSLIGLPTGTVTMKVGETKDINWSYSPNYVDKPTLRWRSTNENVAWIEEGYMHVVLHAKNAGTTNINIVNESGLPSSFNVVVEGSSNVVYVNSISLNETSVSLSEGSTKQLQATVLPSNATDKSVSWSTSNSSVAQVNSSGLVTAKSTGSAIITCTANDGSGKSATCTVTVKSSTIEPITIVLPNYIENIKVGETITLVPTIAPSNATTTLSWTSSDNSVATVSQSGVVNGIKVGESKITVTTSNNKSAYCYVKVAEDVVYVSSISLNSTSATLNTGDTKQLTATISPSNATDKSVSWSSSNSSVAQVSSSGLVTAKSAGSATITCKANDGSGTSATCSVTVNSASVEPTSISVSPSSKSVKVGDTFYCSYTLSPSNATTTVTWSSDNSSIATVSSSGKVTAKSVGSTYINAKTANWKTDWCRVTVESATLPKLVLSASPSGGQVSAGEKVTLTAKANGSTVSGCDIYFTTNGTTPSRSNGTKYSSGITINSACTLKAIAYKSGYEDSNVLTATYTVNTEPVKVVSVATGMYHSLFLTADGSLWACGGNDQGQLGDGTKTDKHTPVKIMDNVASMAADGCSSFIIKNDGSLWACGENGGAYGNGTTTSSSTPVKIMDGVASVSSSFYNHTLIVKTDGSLWACGKNDEGQLGDGTTTTRLTPVKIMDGVKSVAAGQFKHSLIVKNDGSVWACGNNTFGQLGDGTTTNRLKPVKIMDGVLMVSAGAFYSLFLKTDGSLWGSGMTTAWELSWSGETSSPVKILDGVLAVSAGDYHILAIKNNNSLWACGLNREGELGDGTTTARTFGQVATSVACVSGGGGEDLFAYSLFVKTDGSVWACGDNYYGQLGDGTTVDRPTPVLVKFGDESAIPAVISERNSGQSVFSLSGQRLAAPRKGVNIIGGKKVVVK